ncbi:MAG: hypothetical protein WCI74_13510, partial [Actinomycetes bacterium]
MSDSEPARMADLIAESDVLLRAMMNGGPEAAAFYFDTNLRILIAGGSKLADMGLAPAELENKTIREAFNPAIAARIETACRAALNNEPGSVENPFNGRLIA